MRESKIEKLLRTEIEKRGGLCLKWVSPGRTGVPDRIVILPGHGVKFVELKRTGGRLSEVQKQLRQTFLDLCHPVYVLESEKDVEHFLEWMA